MVTLISFKTTPDFLAYYLGKYKVIKVLPGDRLSDLIQSGEITDKVLFQINLTHFGSFFSDTQDPYALLKEAGKTVLNDGLVDISKSWIHHTLTSLNLPHLRYDKENYQPGDRVIIKSNFNYGGLLERQLPAETLARLGVRNDFSAIPGYNEYSIMDAIEVPEAYWENTGLVIERFVENQENSYLRIYKNLDRYVLSEAFVDNPIKKMDDCHTRINTYYTSKTLGSTTNKKYKNALSMASLFCEDQNIDFATIDFVSDNNENVYLIDVNDTPYMGPEIDPEFINFYRVDSVAVG